MLFARLIIISLLFGIIEHSTVQSISNFSHNNKYQSIISTSSSQQNKEVWFEAEETFYEEEDENETELKKHPNNKLSGDLTLSNFNSTILLAHNFLGSKHFTHKQHTYIPLYLSFCNFRI